MRKGALSWLFLGAEGPACPDSADADANGLVEVTDAIHHLLHRFLGGLPPPAPYHNCGRPSLYAFPCSLDCS